MNKPIIAICPGDPAGIGPEITLKALLSNDIYDYACPLVVCDKATLEKEILKIDETIELNQVDENNKFKLSNRIVNYYNSGLPDLENIEYGKIQAAAGKASYLYLETAINLVKNKKADAICTGPINKESIKAAKINHIGHTEMLGDLLGADDPLTMFEVSGLRIFFLSRHVSLRQACDMVTEDRIYEYVNRCSMELENLGIENPSIVVAALNPHGGENGMFGTEEQTEIIPAIKKCQKEELNVHGPIGADTVFHLVKEGKYDAVLSLYHDQGHIAAKTLDFEKTISLTLGLPFLRTSVDHGTAMDIAGKGIANPASMIEAIRIAGKYCLK